MVLVVLEVVGLVALGITTGLGGFGIATICGLITSLGCIGATNYICS
nr:hypothetical protein [Staphylococcus equorum]